MHSLFDHTWIDKTLICTMHNVISYLWIGKINLQYTRIVKHDFELSMDTQK